MSNKKVYLLLAVFLVPLLFGLGVEMLWNTESGVKTYSKIMLATGTIATSKLDSMACFPWSPRFTIVAGPGYNDTSCFSRGIVNTGYGDSILQTIAIRGWTTPNRTHNIFTTLLWTGGEYTQFARPKGNFWASTTQTRNDSTVRYLIARRADFFMNVGAGTSREDSLKYYTGTTRGTNGDGKNIYIPWAPYYDIVMADSAGKTGKNCRVKITVFAFSDN